MSSSSDPFGRSDRTIIMPDPAGRRSASAPEAAGSSRAPSPASVVRATASSPDDWASPERAPPPASQASGMPLDEQARALVLRRDVVVAPHENPFLRAAGPLLLLLGRLRVQLSHASFANLMEQVAASIEEFEKDARGAGASPEQTRIAKYVVCATADDIVQNIPTDERHVWTQHSMLSRFFGERTGGVKFFEELERAKVDPSGNYHLLELLHACLALGFAGIHRTSAGGAATLQQIQRNLHELLRRTRQASRELSPRWEGQRIAAEAFRFNIPLWAVGSVVGAFLLGLYFLLRMLLSGSAEAAASALVEVHPTTEVGIQRRIYKPPPPPPAPAPTSQAALLRTALRAEIESQKLVIAESGNQVVIRIVAALFGPGEATIKPEFVGLIKKLGGLVEQEPGAVRVVGHTDSSPIRNVRFPSNFHLSQERAKAVAEVVKSGLSQPGRVELEGKGADVPIAPNTSPVDRAKNRRVEVLIPRSR